MANGRTRRGGPESVMVFSQGECERLGLVERHPGRQDRRGVEVRLLPTGEEKLERIARPHPGELHPLLRELAEAEG